MKKTNAIGNWTFALVGFGICTLSSPTAAFAQTEAAASASPEVISNIYACANHQNDADRLACYDAAVARLHHAEQSGQVVAIDRERAAHLQRESFGFNLPSLARLIPDFRGGQPNGVSRIETQLSGIADQSNGYHVYRFANGQTWADIEPTTGLNPRAGDSVIVRQAVFGSFMMTTSRGGGARRVRRQE